MMLHIACTVDEKYLRPFLAMMSSFCEHHRGGEVTLHLFCEELEPEAKARLDRFLGDRHVVHRHYPIHRDQFSDMRVCYPHFSKANYYRLLIPERLSGTDRVLYLDVDILIRKSLAPLFHTPLDNQPAAAAPDAYPPGDCARLGIPEHLGYFNSGVLLMDLPRWRREGIAEQALNYVRRHHGDPAKCLYGDQDALNMTLLKRWKPVGDTWNFNVFHCRQYPRTLTDAQRQCLREGPAVIHYAHREKPWMRHCALPFQREYLRNAAKNGLQFPFHLTPRNAWVWVTRLYALHRVRLPYHLAGIPWNP